MEIARVRVEDAHLGGAGLDDPRMGVAHVGDVVHAVEIGAAVGVVEVRALAADDVERRPVAERERWPEQPAAGREEVVRGRSSARRDPGGRGGRFEGREPLQQRPGRRLGDRQVWIVRGRAATGGRSGRRWSPDAARRAPRGPPARRPSAAAPPRSRIGRRRRPPAGRPRRARRRRPRPRARCHDGPDGVAEIEQAGDPRRRLVDEDVVVVRVVVDHAVAESRAARRRAGPGAAATPASRAAWRGSRHGVGVGRDDGEAAPGLPLERAMGGRMVEAVEGRGGPAEDAAEIDEQGR